MAITITMQHNDNSNDNNNRNDNNDDNNDNHGVGFGTARWFLQAGFPPTPFGSSASSVLLPESLESPGWRCQDQQCRYCSRSPWSRKSERNRGKSFFLLVITRIHQDSLGFTRTQDSLTPEASGRPETRLCLPWGALDAPTTFS